MLGINHLPSTNLKVQSTFFSKTMSGLALTRHPIESVLPLKYTETQQAIMRPPVGICVKEVYAVKRSSERVDCK